MGGLQMHFQRFESALKLKKFKNHCETVSCHKWKVNLYRIPELLKEKDAENNSDNNKQQQQNQKPDNLQDEPIFLTHNKAIDYQLSKIRCYFQCNQCCLAFK